MIALNGIQLPGGLLWNDEFSWQPVAQVTDRALDGGLIVFSAPLAAGRPITLASGAWLNFEQVTALQELASRSGGRFDLQMRGVSQLVMFRHEEKPAFSVEPVWPIARPGPDDRFIATIKLMTI